MVSESNTSITEQSLTVVDFFCGAGGFSEGFRMAGFDVIMGIDNWQPSITTHNANHGLNDVVKNILDFEDIEEIYKLPNSDIIVGSPPCVLFSLSNRGGNANKDLGVRLIKAFYRVIVVKKFQKRSILKAWLMENVPNSRNYVDPYYTFKDLGLEDWAISEGLDPSEPAIKVKENGAVLSSNDYGAAQTRKRFVCGEIVATGEFPMPDKKIANAVTLSNLFSGFPKPMGEKYNHSAVINDPNYPELSVTINSLHDHFYDTGVYEIEWKKAREAKKNHPYMGVMSFPENINKPSRTIMATKSASTREAILYKSELNRIGDGEYRTPTIREAAMIMGFPLTYQFYGNESTKWRQVGNAVCVQLSYALANKVKGKLHLNLSDAKELKKDLSSINFLDNAKEKAFDKPPKRSSSALFRTHPIKSGNVTVDLTNRGGENGHDWQVVAHAGTGKGYNSTVITRRHREVAKCLIDGEFPEFIKIVDNDDVIKPFSKLELDKMNQEYGYTSTDINHPYNIVRKIADSISLVLNDDNHCIPTIGTVLSDIKTTLPMSQVMSIYALSKLVDN